MNIIKQYIQKFRKLKRAHYQGESAPHKPVLLLAIIRLIQNREITENKIFITPELVAAFKDTWHLLVTGTKFTTNFSLPFYHLKSEGFWHLHTYPGKEILLTSSNSIRSFGHLKDAVWYASFDEALFDLLLQDKDRAIFQQALLQAYFPALHSLVLPVGSGLADTITNQMLQESAVAYRQTVAGADEEEIFIRGGIFKKLVPSIYNYTCCISRMRITTAYNIQMIDACHIIPFSQSHDDTIENGIPLCPNLHRAFDRGLLAISDDYRVVISTGFSEDIHTYAIRQFEGVTILLPQKRTYHPAITNLAWHRQQIFKQ